MVAKNSPFTLTEQTREAQTLFQVALRAVWGLSLPVHSMFPQAQAVVDKIYKASHILKMLFLGGSCGASGNFPIPLPFSLQLISCLSSLFYPIKVKINLI